jgi:uncharacterized DUF497 family protein
MRYEWNEGKRAANLAKHGVDFCKAEDFDWASAIEARDQRFDYGEERWIALGMIGSRLHVLGLHHPGRQHPPHQLAAGQFPRKGAL